MARPKKDGNRATGIYGKHGSLYVVLSHTIISDGQKKYKNEWINTNLADTTANIKKASEIREIILGQKSNKVSVDKNITMSDYIDIFLSEKQREVADTTYSGYYNRSRHISDFFKKIKVKDIHKHDIEVFLDTLLIEKNLEARTVKDIRRLFHLIMNKAVEDGIIVINPVKDLKLNKNLLAEHSKAQIDDDFFSYDEAILFLDKAKEHPLYNLFYFTLFFGLRRSEVLGLKWSCIDFRNKTMNITHTVTKGTTINRLNTTKTETSQRFYPLSDTHIELLENLKKIENENKRLCGNCYKDNDYIFKHIDGSLFYPDYPSKAFLKIIKANPDLPQHITFHGLRKSCVSILVHEGYDIKSIQNWVGHADIDTTLKIYTKIKNIDAKKEILDGMSKKLHS